MVRALGGVVSAPWVWQVILESLATLTLGSSKINQHCWRFHGFGVIAAPQIKGLISFCTGMHHEYFLRSSMCFLVPHLCSKIPKINNWSMDSHYPSINCLFSVFSNINVELESTLTTSKNTHGAYQYKRKLSGCTQCVLPRWFRH